VMLSILGLTSDLFISFTPKNFNIKSIDHSIRNSLKK
jgi:hypothetical protein